MITPLELNEFNTPDHSPYKHTREWIFFLNHHKNVPFHLVYFLYYSTIAI